jgi:hypothetical protein
MPVSPGQVAESPPTTHVVSTVLTVASEPRLVSSRTPEECIELATDESAAQEDREDAIDALKLSNDCDDLEDLVRMETLQERYRRHALQALATPQCDSTLRVIADDDGMEQELRDEADSLLAELDGD